MKILSVSHSVLQENSPHAGGNTYAYYMRQISKESDMELHVVCMGTVENQGKANFSRFNATGKVLLSKGSILLNVNRVIWDLYGKITRKTVLNSYFKSKSYVNELIRLKKSGYVPDIIVLEWTQCVSLARKCHELFPEAKIVGSEHDVTFLSFRRKAENEKSWLKKLKKQRLAKLVKNEELEAIKYCDIVLPHNLKDAKLLEENNVDTNKIFPIVAYYSDKSGIERRNVNHDVIFWGAMSRPENYEAAIWFVENVMPKLENTDVRFVIIGNKPNERLLKYRSEKVIITGFVEDPNAYFSEAMCMAIPLSVGAGIKVKVLEAMSAGIPVLTNDIGIEGIPAIHGESYFNCKTSEEYVDVIYKLINKEIDGAIVGNKERRLVGDNFNLKQSGERYINMLRKIVS